MEDKYHITTEQNIFLAKRNLVDYIWKSANLEGIAVTYPDTQCICDGMSVAGYSIDDINAVNDLKHAWMYLLEHVREPLDVDFICRLHRELGRFTVVNAGSLRIQDVWIGGTDWRPGIPDRQKIQAKVSEILQEPCYTKRAIDMMLYCARGQFFYDGNKRLAMLVANKIMIEAGAGIISVGQKHKDMFLQKLIHFYESDNGKELTDFLYDNCIDGIAFLPEEQIEPREACEELNITM